ncbi:MAG: tRNA dihydrouridine synthase DusB, partial [Ignavibacteriaceae bacterium]|nr:tRNA dihydrouridine synthase DusB [Ignavibacteriaceae bacterium]
ELKIKTCIRHLELSLPVKGDRRAILEHRKFYSGYLKGMRNASHTRMKLMQTTNMNEIREILLSFLEELETSQVEN